MTETRLGQSSAQDLVVAQQFTDLSAAAQTGYGREENSVTGNTGLPSIRKGVAWSETEHLQFLEGLRAFGKGQWKQISRYFVTTRTPTQVASHAQKHFLRVTGVTKRRSRFTAVEENALTTAGRTAFPAAPFEMIQHPATSAAALPGGARPPLPPSHCQNAAFSHQGQIMMPPPAGADGTALGIPIHTGGGADQSTFPQATSSTGGKIPMLITTPGRITAPIVYENKPRSPPPQQQPMRSSRRAASPSVTQSVSARRAQLLRLGELREKLNPKEQQQADKDAEKRLQELRENWGASNSAGSGMSDDSDAAGMMMEHPGLAALAGIAAALVADSGTN